MSQQQAIALLAAQLTKKPRRRQRDTSGTKTFWGLTPTTVKQLKLLGNAGLRQGDIINAAIDALLIHLVRNGKIGGEMKATLLSLEQQGLLAHQAMGQALIDSDGRPRSKQLQQRHEQISAYLAGIEENGVKPKKRGRPKRTGSGYSNERTNGR